MTIDGHVILDTNPRRTGLNGSLGAFLFGVAVRNFAIGKLTSFPQTPITHTQRRSLGHGPAVVNRRTVLPWERVRSLP